jgi:hypothetical protein
MVLRLAKAWLSGQSPALRSLRQRGDRAIAPLGVVAVGIVPPPLMPLIFFRGRSPGGLLAARCRDLASATRRK